MNELLGFAKELGQSAGQQLIAWQGRAAASVKRDGSVVTEADQALDGWLRDRIQDRYPSHGVLSEEGATTYEGDSITWVIDPLDGTTNFALGVCYWGCSIAVVQDGLPQIGVLVMPALDLMFWGMQGAGAFLNNTRLGGKTESISEQNSFMAICSRTWRYLDLAVPQKGRLLGSAAYDLAAVAQGIAVGCTQVTSHIWDLAAGWLFIHEAKRAVGPLLPEAPQPFPMKVGTDYRDKVFPVAAACEQHLLARIQQAVSVKPDARERFEAIAAAGWDARIWYS